MWSAESSHPAAWGAAVPVFEHDPSAKELLSWRNEVLGSVAAGPGTALLLHAATLRAGPQVRDQVLQAVRGRSTEQDAALVAALRRPGAQPFLCRLQRMVHWVLNVGAVSGTEAWAWLALVGLPEYMAAARAAEPRRQPFTALHRQRVRQLARAAGALPCGPRALEGPP